MLDESIQCLGRWTSNAFQLSFQRDLTGGSAYNVLDDGHLMPSSSLFKLHRRFVLNVKLKFQKGGILGIHRATSQGPAGEGQPCEVPGAVGKSYETPTITFHQAQGQVTASSLTRCAFRGGPLIQMQRRPFGLFQPETPFSEPLYGIIDAAVTWRRILC